MATISTELYNHFSNLSNLSNLSNHLNEDDSNEKEFEVNLPILFQERKRLFALIGEIDSLIDRSKEETREKRIAYLLANPMDDEQYMHILKNFSKFLEVVGDTLFVISTQLSDKCVDTIVDRMLNNYKTTPNKKCKEWLDDIIFDTIRMFSRKYDAEEYIFTHRFQIHKFLDTSSSSE